MVYLPDRGHHLVQGADGEDPFGGLQQGVFPRWRWPVLDLRGGLDHAHEPEHRAAGRYERQPDGAACLVGVCGF